GVAVAAQLADQGAPAPPPQAATHHRTTVDTGLSTTVQLPSTGSTSAPAPPPPPHLPRPHIVWKPIPFPAHRLAETAAYAQRHYGIDTWRLRHPHVIVEHYTESTT